MKNQLCLFLIASVYGGTNLIPPPPTPMIEIIAYKGRVREAYYISHDAAAANEIGEMHTEKVHNWAYKNSPKPDSMKN